MKDQDNNKGPVDPVSTYRYSNKAEMKSAKLDCDLKTPQVESFERGGARKLESESSLKVRKIEKIPALGNKTFKVIS